MRRDLAHVPRAGRRDVGQRGLEDAQSHRGEHEEGGKQVRKDNQFICTFFK